MILDSAELKLLDNEIFDACIIGTGPAGITAALGLESAGHRILLLEGGGTEYTEQSQNIYRGEVTGDKYLNLTQCRLRYLGGTSNHWGGICRTLDEEDFQAKKGFPLTEWPISKKDLDPYLEKASEILEIPEIPADAELETDELKSISFVIPPPVRFKQKYSQQLQDSKSILLATNANVTSLVPKNGAVRFINVSGWDGSKIKIKAKRFILATGGIENSRLLLWSNFLAKGELVKNDKALGKYWMEHPHFTLGEAFLTGKAKAIINQQGRTYYAPTKTLMDDKQILNCGLRFLPLQLEGTKKMVSDLLCIAPKAGKWAADLFNKDLLCGATVRAAWEQEPVINNRIELTDEKDSLGIPRVNLFWNKNENDLRTARVTTEAFGRYLSSNDLGRVQLDDWLTNNESFPENDEIGGPHHLGGTRMAATPDLGVVDQNCKVYGLDNLYIAGSSVFPSGGHANPTMSIVQLTLRLVDHIHASR